MQTNEFEQGLKTIITQTVQSTVAELMSYKSEKKTEKKQLRIATFSKLFDIPLPTLNNLIHVEGFPSYKIGGRWYIDIEQFEKWREKENILNKKSLISAIDETNPKIANTKQIYRR